MLDFIKAVAREAGRTAMQYFDGVRPNDVHAKASPKDMVSAADVAVEELIVSRIRERFPGHWKICGRLRCAMQDGTAAWRQPRRRRKF